MLLAKNITVGKRFINTMSGSVVTIIRLISNLQSNGKFVKGVEYEASNGEFYIVPLRHFQLEFISFLKSEEPRYISVSLSYNLSYVTQEKAVSEIEALNQVEKLSGSKEIITFLQNRGFTLKMCSAHTQEPGAKKLTDWFYNESDKNWEIAEF